MARAADRRASTAGLAAAAVAVSGSGGGLDVPGDAVSMRRDGDGLGVGLAAAAVEAAAGPLSAGAGPTRGLDDEMAALPDPRGVTPGLVSSAVLLLLAVLLLSWSHLGDVMGLGEATPSPDDEDRGETAARYRSRAVGILLPLAIGWGLKMWIEGRISGLYLFAGNVPRQPTNHQSMAIKSGIACQASQDTGGTRVKPMPVGRRRMCLFCGRRCGLSARVALSALWLCPLPSRFLPLATVSWREGLGSLFIFALRPASGLQRKQGVSE